MIEAGPCSLYRLVPELPEATRVRRERAARMFDSRASPYLLLGRMERELGRPFREVAVCGDRRYVRVALSWLAGCQKLGPVAPDAAVTVINGPIGVMRARPRAWIEAPDRGRAE